VCRRVLTGGRTNVSAIIAGTVSSLARENVTFDAINGESYSIQVDVVSVD
jgi:hypothetical protein